ncbi:unnamed protein product [Rotaria sp. Silwood2]|nr:unnamed protein product [Rotaria sp. Silwood2]
MPYRFQRDNVTSDVPDCNPIYVAIKTDKTGLMRLYLVLIKSKQDELRLCQPLKPFHPFQDVFGISDKKSLKQVPPLHPKQLIQQYQLDKSQLAFTFCASSSDGTSCIPQWDTTVYSTVLTEMSLEISKKRIVSCPNCAHIIDLSSGTDNNDNVQEVVKGKRNTSQSSDEKSIQTTKPVISDHYLIPNSKPRNKSFEKENKKMTVETDTIKNPKESPLKAKRKRASRSSSSGSSSSGTSSSSSASSRSSSSSSSNSSSSTSRSSSAASSPEKKNDRTSTKVINNKSSNKKSLEHGSIDDKKPTAPTIPTHRIPSPSSSRRQEKEKEKEATKIYIGKLSLNVTKEHLAEIFGTFGEIKEIDLPSHRIHPNLHRGFAHIEYVSPNGAEQACKYMETGQIDGQEIVCVLVHGQPAHLSADRNRRESSPYHRRRRRSPLPPSRHYPPPRRMGDRERDRGRYNDRRGGYSPPSRSYRRGQSPSASSRRTGTSGNTAESPKKKERRYSRSSSSESK